MTYCISQRNTHLLRMRRILLPFFWNVSLLRTLHNSRHFTHQTGHSSLFVSSCMETEVDLQCLIYKHLIIQSGRVEESGNLVELTRAPLFGDKTLCPEIMEDFSDFGYVPKALRVMDGAITTTHAKSCMIWHVLSSRQNISSRSNSPDPRWRRVCSECLKFTWYVKKRVKAKKSVDAATKSFHQCQVATVLGNSFHQAVKGSPPEMFTSNEPGFRGRQCAFTKKQRLSFQ